MPFVLILAGAVLIVAAVRNTQQQLFYLLALDFTGPHNFIFWFLSILLIGALGYIPKAKPLSDGFLILVVLVLFLRKGTGFFDMFQKQIALTESSSPHVSTGGVNGGNSSTGVSFSGSVGAAGGGPGSIVIGGQPSGGIGINVPGGGGFIGGSKIGGIECDVVSDPLCIGRILSAF